MEYLEHKLRDTALVEKEQIEIRLRKSILSFAQRQGGQSSASMREAQRILTSGIRSMLGAINKIVVERIGKVSEEDFHVIMNIATEISFDLIKNHSAHLFITEILLSDRLRQEEIDRYSALVTGIIKLSLEDLLFDIQRSNKAANDAIGISFVVNKSNIVIDSHGSTIQQGRDGILQNFGEWTSGPLLSTIVEIKSKLDQIPVDREEKEHLHEQLVVLEKHAQKADPNKGLLRRLGNYIADTLKAAGTAAAVKAGQDLASTLPL